MPLKRVRNNLIANFGGQALSVLLAVAFVPIYIRILGIEAYGLIGFFLSLQAFFTVLDMGLSATLNRELARYSHSGVDADQQRDLLRTLEWLYWPIGVLIAVGVTAMSQPIAAHWLKPVSLNVAQTSHAIMLMGFATALQWPTALYGGGFRGLERQVALNGISAGLAAARSVGAVGILLYVSPTLEAFLWWQVIVAAAQTLISRGILWRMLPDGKRAPMFQSALIRELRGFTLGLTGVAALSFFLVQSDRIILSRLLPLNEFGYYTVATTVAAVLSSMIGPFFNALYPRYSGLVSTGQHDELVQLYHFSNQLLAVTVASVAAVLAFFSFDILKLWTHDLLLATNSGPIFCLLVIGTGLHGLLHLPYALQLAYGWTRLALYQNLVTVAVVVPSIWWLAQLYGGVGAASVWVALNLISILIGIPIMHRKLLPDEMTTWYLKDILPPVLAAGLSAGVARALLPSLPPGLAGIVLLAIVGIVTLVATTLSAPAGRSTVVLALRMLNSSLAQRK